VRYLMSSPAGLTRGSIALRKKPECFFRKAMDCRVKPGND
jgi:hypothetical protein